MIEQAERTQEQVRDEAIAQFNAIDVHTLAVRTLPHDSVAYQVRVENTGTTKAGIFEIHAGFGWNASKAHILSHLGTYPQYAFEDGMIEHGLLAYCDKDALSPVRENWCDSLGYDPEDSATRGHYTTWLRDAFKVCEILGDLVSYLGDLD